MKKNRNSSIFDNKTFAKIFSIIGAIIIWAVVTLTVKTTSEKTLRKIPIDFSVNGTAVETLGLSAFEHNFDTVDIHLSGNRGDLNSISKDDISVTLRLGKVSNAGKYTLGLDVSLKNSIGNVKILNYSPKNIEVNFDRTAFKTLQVQTNISAFSAENGYLLDKGYPSSSEVTISGPESIINTVSSCIAKIDSKSKTLNQTATVSDVPLILLNDEGTAITNSSITMDKEMVDISVPVLKTKELPINVQFINAPNTFNEDELNYSLSVSKISLAGPSETIDGMSQLELKYVDLKEVKPGDNISLNIELPSGFVNINNIESVDISIPETDYISKTVNAMNFKLIGIPDNKKIDVLSRQLNNIKLMGNKKIIDSIVASDIVVEVDVSGLTLSAGTLNVPATVSIPGKSGAFWAYGSYEVMIKIEDK